MKTPELRSFVEGMEFAMRICRNRADSLKDAGFVTELSQEVETCAGIIRVVQVEIGSGRSPIPKFSDEEQEEMNRIS